MPLSNQCLEITLIRLHRHHDDVLLFSPDICFVYRQFTASGVLRGNWSPEGFTTITGGGSANYCIAWMIMNEPPDSSNSVLGFLFVFYFTKMLKLEEKLRKFLFIC